MIDPIHSLAFSVQSSPGVYALLLGSGVSRSAGIPTGWEIVLDLLRKLARASGQPDPSDPGRWYKDQYGEDPDYSKILAQLAKTPSERQQLLRSYFEPNNQEREEGRKQPTRAHQAIAKLAAQGFVKLIVTTNFDKLIERALEEESVTPTVVSTVNQIKGALPLVHNERCYILKIHGDYLDSRIRNSTAELSKYPRELDRLLNQIFDEYGLLISGWSGESDGALRDAIYRTKSRRFTTFWTIRGEPSGLAKELIGHRRAEQITIGDADSFFQHFQETVEGIEQFSQPHPLSVEASVTTLKLYLSRPEYKIRLSDLVGATTQSVILATSGEQFNLSGMTPDKDAITKRVRLFDAASSVLVAMAPVAAFWADEENFAPWLRALLRLSTTIGIAGQNRWLALRTYPGRLLLYSLGMGLVESNNLNQLGRVFSQPVPDSENQNKNTNILKVLVENKYGVAWQGFLEGMESNREGLSRWIHNVLQQPLKQITPDEVQYTFCFDKFEVLLALGFAYRNNSSNYWFHAGDFVNRPNNWTRIVTEIEDSLTNLGVSSPFVESEIFGKTPADCLDLLGKFREFIWQGTPTLVRLMHQP